MKFFVFVTALLFGSLLFSQNVEFDKKNFDSKPKDFFKAVNNFTQGIDFHDQGAYNLALKYLLPANDFNPNNAELNYLIGNCYLNTIYKIKALKFIEKSMSLDEEYSYNTVFLLGQANQYNYKFKKAKTLYYKFQLSLPADSLENWQPIIDKKILECNNGMELMKNPTSGIVVNQRKVNSGESDYAPVLSIDGKTMFFTSRREGSVGGDIDKDDYQLFEDIYYSTKKEYRWSDPVNMSETINTKLHDATVGISPDGEELYIYKGEISGGDIFVSKKENNTWSKPAEIKGDVNTKSHENSASIAGDNKTMYFVSDKPGGHGGKDIYIATRNKNGAWTDVKNLESPINTKYDEEAVFISPNQDVIYFSSNGNKTMGGYDIFYSVKNDDGNWSEPVNMGYPINSPDDDVFFFVSADGRQAYFSSVRIDGKGKKDIYTINFSENLNQNLKYLASNSVYNCNTKCKQQSCVTLDVTYFTDKNAEELKYDWDLGDGTIKYGSKIDHCYAKTGKYHIILSSTTKQGIRTENIKSTDIEINGNITGKAIIDCPEYALVNSNIVFDASKSYYTDGKITKYLWNFNDGVTDSLTETNHTYKYKGEHKVDLKVLAINTETDSCCYAKASKIINIYTTKNKLRKELITKKDILDFDDNFINNEAGLYKYTCEYVDSTNNMPIPGTRVIAECKDDTTKYEGITDINGKVNFIFDNSKDYKISSINDRYYDKSFIHTTANKTEPEFSYDKVKLIPKNYQLYGNVYDRETKKPIKGALVKFVDLKTGKNILTTTTDENGYFSYATGDHERNAIKYDIFIDKEGYLKKSVNLPLKFNEQKRYNLNDYVDLYLDKVHKNVLAIENIYFGFDKWNITSKASKKLDKIVKLMKEHSSMVIELGSHTDCQGSARYNMILSKRRAKSSINYIISKGISNTRVSGEGYGETMPVTDCDCNKNSKRRCTKAENKLNRRTEFKIVKM